MTNLVEINRSLLEEENYVIKADSKTSYWFGISVNKVQYYQEKRGLDFNVILFGNSLIEGDYYIIPYNLFREYLTPNTITIRKGSNLGRWVGDIRNHKVYLRKSNRAFDISDCYGMPITKEEVITLSEDEQNDYSIENRKIEIQGRIKQSVFRRKVLENFNHKCCISDISETSLLVASHIIPWSQRISTRLNPRNGICFSVLYDKLFDLGYFSLKNDMTIIVSNDMSNYSSKLVQILNKINGAKIDTPKISLDTVFLDYHRQNIFKS